jgi:hypothetical protein
VEVKVINVFVRVDMKTVSQEDEKCCEKHNKSWDLFTWDDYKYCM